MPAASQPHLTLMTPSFWSNSALSPPFMTQCHRIALNRLGGAFADAKPVVMLTGEGTLGASQVVGGFLRSLDEDVEIVRIRDQCDDAIGFMRAVVGAIELKPKDLSLGDLENIFTMFLSYQRTHSRRTIIWVAETEKNGWWVLDKIRRLVELERKRKYGLMIILSGQTSLAELLYESPMDAIAEDVGQRITLAPFTVAETRAFIRQRVHSAGISDIGQIFNYQAITLIHELAAGVPDAVSDLCCKCLHISHGAKLGPVPRGLVTEASKLCNLEASTHESSLEQTSTKVNSKKRSLGRLIARVKGEVVREIPINNGHILIGRDQLSEICIGSGLVSRHHALIFNSKFGLKLADLGSKNGTYVGGQKVTQYTLEDKDVIAVGDCQIEFLASDEHAQNGSDSRDAGTVQLYQDEWSAEFKTFDDEEKSQQPANLTLPSRWQRVQS